MKKYILFLILSFIPILSWTENAHDYNSVEKPWKYDFTKGLPQDNHIPTCYTLGACPICRMNCTSNVATKRYCDEDEKGKFVMYMCEGGHQCYFYYKLVKNPNYPNRNKMVKEYIKIPIDEVEEK